MRSNFLGLNFIQEYYLNFIKGKFDRKISIINHIFSKFKMLLKYLFQDPISAPQMSK